MTTITADLSIEIRSANGTSTEFYQGDEERIAETLRLLAAPRLFAQPHLLLTSQDCASMIPCKGIDMILARTSAQTPLKFPVNLPVGLFDLVEQSEDGPAYSFAETEDPRQQKSGQAQRHISRVEIHTLGGWKLTLKTIALIRGNIQD